MAVPPADGNNAVITVKVGGDRSGVNGVTSLAGVVLGFYDNATGGTPAYQCTSDADGDCSITVPDTQPDGANRDSRFYVRQISAPAGWYQNPDLRTGSNGPNPTFATPYVFQTGNRLRSGNTYRSGSAFMIDMIDGNNRNRLDSGGVWQNSRTNPVLPQTCGLDVGLVMDFSGSTENFLPQLKQAANTFVDALVGTPSRMSLFSFASNSPAGGAQNYPNLTSVSTQAQANAFKARYSRWTSGDGTNWDRGLAVAAAAGNPFDVVVVITDGNPTQYSSPPKGFSGNGRLIEAEAGIFSANAIKAEGTRVIAVGVGTAVTRDPNADLNLRAISGQTEFDGSNSATADFYRTLEYSAAGDALKELALGNCVGSISVVKQVVPSTAPPGSIEGAEPDGGWMIDAASAAPGISVNSPASRVTADGTGAVNFPLTFEDATTTGAVGITETQQSGYDLQQVAGKNAVCARSDTGADVAVTNQGALGFTVPVSSTYPVSCILYNRAPGPQASVVVDKLWAVTVDGVTTRYPDGAQPVGLDASATIDGTSQDWGNPRRGFGVGDTVTIDETTSITGRPLCTSGTPSVTEANGEPATAALPYSPTLASGLNRYEITNPVTCRTQLTVAKGVLNGDAAPSLWDLNATAPAGALPGPSGKTGTGAATNVPVTANVVYTLAESGGDPRYIQRANPTATPIPGSTVSWQCLELTADGETVIPGYSDGLNGGVSVPLGSNVRCTAYNYTATLQIRKVVQNTHGGTAVPADFTITATPTGDDLPPSLTAQTVTGDSVYQAFTVRPNVTYRITETGPDGYTQESIDCTVTAGQPKTDGTVEVPPLETGSCTIVNVDSQAKLTLVKTVTNDNGGTAEAIDWNLSAAGPTPITGATGATKVTGATVNAGSYDLSEAGPAGYTASDWSCTGATLTEATVVVPNGGDVTCTIDNDDQPAKLTLVKVVDPAASGSGKVPADWNLTATPVSIPGQDPVSGNGDSAGPGGVDEVPVFAGDYTLTEAGPTGFTPGSWICQGGVLGGTKVTVPSGGNVTCTITNTAVSPTLTLVKKVVNKYGGTALEADWLLKAAGPSPISGRVGDPSVTAAPVQVGTYDLSETGPSGYEASEWVCTGGASTTGTSVTLAEGSDATCIITNTDEPAKLTLVKTVTNDNGGTAAPADWTLNADGPSAGVTGPVGDPAVTAATVSPGSYELTEADGPPGYAASDWSCTGGTLTAANIVVPNGGDVTCTINNDDQRAKLTLVKKVINDNGGTAEATDWKLSADGPTAITGTTGTPDVTKVSVDAGSYDLTEAGGPAGYTASDWSCTGGTLTGASVAVPSGGDVTCTIFNDDDQAILTLVKFVDNAGTGGTGASADWTLSATGPTRISGPGSSNQVTAQKVDAGEYPLAESGGTAGYTASGWVCEGGKLDRATVTVPIGGDVTCTITNTAQQSHLTLIKRVTKDDGGAAVPTDWTLSADGPTADVTGHTGEAEVTSVPVEIGSYALSESDGPAGYAAGPWNCDNGGLTGSDVTIGLGQDVTCIIVNNDVPATTPPTVPPTVPPVVPELPDTGANLVPLLGVGGLLMLLGSAALWFGRRPRRMLDSGS